MLGAIIGFLLIGVLAGWIAGLIMKGRGFGFWGDMIVGVIGALIGGFIVRLFGIQLEGHLVVSLIAAIVGAVILLAVISFIKREEKTV